MERKIDTTEGAASTAMLGFTITEHTTKIGLLEFI